VRSGFDKNSGVIWLKQNDDYREVNSNATGDEPGETFQTHRPVEPDPDKQLPRPGPIPQTVGVGTRRDSRAACGIARTNGSAKRSSVEIEELHINDLKQNQYAWQRR
jgi:hypothetical protein